MGELFIKVIEYVGVDSCVQIITDNALVCKYVGMIVEAKYPQLLWTPCIVQSLNLALKYIASDVSWIGNLNEMHAISAILCKTIPMLSQYIKSTHIYHC